jgi:FPC/CPF motif-containing protein YcgG
MADKFVSVIRQDGSPGPLYGPYDYHEAEQVLYAVLKSNTTENGPVEITADVEEVIDSDGSYSFDGGGGVYIVESEAFAPEDDEEIDEEIDE